MARHRGVDGLRRPHGTGLSLAEVLLNGGWLVPLTYLLLLFPDGRLPSRSWRPMLWVTSVALGSTTAMMAFGRYLGGASEYGHNPYHLPAVAAIAGVGSIAIVPAVIGALTSLIVRYRRSGDVERLQLKWLAFSAGVTVASIIGMGAAFALGLPLSTAWANAVTLVGIATPPVAIGVAVVRYRLYDIDRLISRTAGYSLSVAGLVVLYAAVVVGAAELLPVASGSHLLVAGATLAVVALFRPLTSGIQGAVDRHFYRQRYDAQRTISQFGARLRHDIDVDALSDELRRVVIDTVRPDRIDLWLVGAPPATLIARPRESE